MKREKENRDFKERQTKMDEMAKDLKANGFKLDKIRDMKRGKKSGEPAFRHGDLSIDMDSKGRVVFQVGKAKFKFTEEEINTRLAQADEKAVMEKMKERMSELEKDERISKMTERFTVTERRINHEHN